MILKNNEILDLRIDEVEYIVFDIESTGVNPYGGDKIVEIGAVRILPGLKIDRKNTFTQLVNPGIRIPDDSTKIHGITNEDVRNAPDECEAFYRFLDFAKGSVLVAHNAKKDVAFLRRITKDYGIKFPFDFVVDTLALSKRLNCFTKRHNLDALIDVYNVNIISKYKRHRALYDAEATAVLFKMMLKRLMNDNIFSLIDLLVFMKGK